MSISRVVQCVLLGCFAGTVWNCGDADRSPQSVDQEEAGGKRVESGGASGRGGRPASSEGTGGAGAGGEGTSGEGTGGGGASGRGGRAASGGAPSTVSAVGGAGTSRLGRAEPENSAGGVESSDVDAGVGAGSGGATGVPEAGDRITAGSTDAANAREIGGSGDAGGSRGEASPFVLSSAKLAPGADFPADFTCEGDAHSPPFSWTAGPSGTKSYAIVFLDTSILAKNANDAKGYHWAIWDIPADTTSLPEKLPVGSPLSDPEGAKQKNPIRASYLGPCPNTGTSTPDQYEFRLFALKESPLSGTLSSVQSILTAITDSNPLAVTALKAQSNAKGTLK